MIAASSMRPCKSAMPCCLSAPVDVAISISLVSAMISRDEILRTGSEYLAFDGQISEMLRFPHSVVGSALSSRTGDGLTRSAWLAWGGGSVLAHLRIPARMYLLGHRKPARASSSIPSAAAHCSSNSVVPRATRTCNIRPALPGKSSHFAYDRNHGHGNGGFSVASGQRSAVWRVS